MSFAEAIERRDLLICDGAMGTQLSARSGVPSPAANVECPDLVRAIHSDYLGSGADVVLTNTLMANRIALEHARLADRFVELNRRGVDLCHEAVAGGCWIGGDMCSTGQLLEPLGDYTEQQFHDNAAEQAALLAECGVDFIIIETMTDVREAAIATRAAKAATSLPVVTSVAFDSVRGGFRTVMGDTIEGAVAELAAAGADAIGANCGTVSPAELSEIIAAMRALSDLPLVAQPNAGKPDISGGRVTFRLSPERFAEGAAQCVEAGASLVGGCCGTSPAHIAALLGRLRGNQ